MSDLGKESTDSSKGITVPESLPLPVQTQTLTSRTQIVSKEVTYKSQAVKRSIRENEVEEELNDETLISSTNSGEWESLNSSSRRKSRRISYTAYREPPVLQSLDSDAFKNLFDPSSLSDSQNSEAGSWSVPHISPFSSAKITPTDSLGSLGDIIQQCNNATLNSMKFDFPLDEGDNAQSSPRLLSPVCREVESKQTSTFSSSVATHANTASCDSNNESILSAPNVDQTGDKQERNVESENLMSITLDISTVSEEKKEESILAALNVDQTEDKQERNVESENLMSITVDVSTVSEEKKEIHVTEVQTSETHSKSKSLSVAEDLPLLKTYEEQLELVEEENKAQSSDEQEEKCNKSKTTETLNNSNLDENLQDFEVNLLENVTCKKNHGHQEFYSPTELQVGQLPKEIQHEDSVTFLNCISQLVVQITVNSTSAARGPADQYKHYFGTSKERNGSGFIASVDEHIIRHRCRREDCPYACDEGNSSYEESLNVTSPTFNRNLSNMSTASNASSSSSGGGGPRHYMYSGVYVHTNKHVIFDKSEADNAYVKFFYNTPDGEGVIEGHVGAIVGVNNRQDHVILHVMSHERSLFDFIGLHIKNAHSSYKQMVESTHKTHQLHGHKHKHSWVSVIAHPHGKAKAITVGRIRCEVTEATRVVKYYDAATCPGSSGGLVLTPTLLKLQWPGAVHSSYDRETGFNVTLDSRFPDLDFKHIGKINKTNASKKKKSSY